MGGVKKAVKSVGSVFDAPDPPEPPKLPEPTLMEDPEQTADARRKTLAANLARSGRASTALSGAENRNRQTLGGG